MKAHELKAELEEFQKRLDEHRNLWGQSLDRTIPDHPIRNVDVLREQSRWLSRKLGTLRPFMERFFEHWIMSNRMAGVSWNALESATGLESVAQIKGPSMRTVSERIDQMLGELDTYDPEDEIPRDTKQPIRPGIGVDRLMQHIFRSYIHTSLKAAVSYSSTDTMHKQSKNLQRRYSNTFER